MTAEPPRNCTNKACPSFMKKTRMEQNHFVCPDCVPSVEKRMARLVGTNDPTNSFRALAQYGFKSVISIEAKLAALFIANLGVWFSEDDLVTYTQRKSAARRARGLRDDPYRFKIECDDDPPGSNTWFYHLDQLP